MLETERDERLELGEHAGRYRASGSSAIRTLIGRLYFDWLTPAALVIGVFLRTREWLFDKSMWLDELMVGYNITHRGFAGLLQPLRFNQAGPIGWLWAERASIELFGTNDLTLRLPEWVASIVALGLFPLVARRLIGRSAVPAATVIFATSAPLIFYAAETKQYSFDVTCALLALLATTWLARRRPALGPAVLWGLVCAVLVWCSQPAILVCAVGGLVLAVMWFREWRTLLPVLAGGAILGLSVALDWAVALKRQSANVHLQGFWREVGGYPPLRQTASGDLHWLWTAVTITARSLDFRNPYVAVGLMACGLAAVTLSRRQFPGLLLALPLATAVGFAVTGHYPLSGRLALYLFPIIVMLLAAPLALADRQPRGTARWWRPAAVVASAAALLAVAAPAIAVGVDKAIRPDQGASERQAVAFVSEHQHPGDLVLAQTGATSVLALEFYGSRYHVRAEALFFLARAGRHGCADPFLGLGRVTRIWLITAESSKGQPANRNQIYESSLAPYGRLMLSYTGVEDAGAYLFDIGARPAHVPPLTHAAPGQACLGIRPLQEN